MSLENFKEKGTDNFGIEVENQEELADLSEYEKFNLNELEPEIELVGRPHIMYFENDESDERNYEALRVQIINDKEEEVVNIYCNIPLGYPIVKNIRRNNSFFKNSYNLIVDTFHVDDSLDDTVFYDSKGEIKNTIKKINIKQVIDYINSKKEIKIKVIENGDYNSFNVLSLK